MTQGARVKHHPLRARDKLLHTKLRDGNDLEMLRKFEFGRLVRSKKPFETDL